MEEQYASGQTRSNLWYQRQQIDLETKSDDKLQISDWQFWNTNISHNGGSTGSVLSKMAATANLDCEKLLSLIYYLTNHRRIWLKCLNFQLEHIHNVEKRTVTSIQEAAAAIWDLLFDHTSLNFLGMIRFWHRKRCHHTIQDGGISRETILTSVHWFVLI